MPGFSNFQRFRFDFIQMEGIWKEGWTI
jgi:hypothetical protein